MRKSIPGQVETPDARPVQGIQNSNIVQSAMRVEPLRKERCNEMTERKKKVISVLLKTVAVVCILCLIIAIAQELYADYAVRIWEQAGYPDLRGGSKVVFWIKLLLFSGIALMSTGAHMLLFPKEKVKSSDKAQLQLSTNEVFERCVLCGKLTDIPKGQPVTQRSGYIAGGGQLCESCYEDIYVRNRSGRL